MNLNMDIEKLVELEIKSQVGNVVKTKMKDLTMKKLNNMGYDVKGMIERIIREEVIRQLNVKDFVAEISKESILNRSAELFKEELFEAIDERNLARY